MTTAPRGFEGEGFPVRRAFAGVDLAALDPFIHMDQMGSIDYGPYEPRGDELASRTAGSRPSRTCSTAPWQHQDSHGGGGLISDGDTQWMTAGSGILHIETPPEQLVVSGGRFHGIQLWVNLPGKDKMLSPAYQGITGDDILLLSSPDGGALVRVVAGDVDGHVGPGGTHTPITFVHATVSPGARLDLPWHPGYNALVYALSGTGTVGAEGVPFGSGQLAVLGGGSHISVTADPSQSTDEPALDVLVLGGEPIGEPVATYGPFVMNTRAELQTAVDDFNAGRLGVDPARRPHALPALSATTHWAMSARRVSSRSRW